ncbi:MAG TPA: hypothetical protein DEP35_07030 [Deltaproteobacteria bacterium]|nr:hypothetical protein [Deltaproteobacteria bacterium]
MVLSLGNPWPAWGRHEALENGPSSPPPEAAGRLRGRGLLGVFTRGTPVFPVLLARVNGVGSEP